MSILGQHSSEDLGGRGKPLPNAKYRGTIESTQIGPDGNGTRFLAQVGQLTTPDGANEFQNGDGSMYRIGNRKVFVREWFDHQNTQAAEIGKRRLKQLLIATGIVTKPTKGETVGDPFDTVEEMAETLNGRSFLFTTKQRTRMNKDGAGNLTPIYEDDGTTPKIDVEISVFHAP